MGVRRRQGRRRQNHLQLHPLHPLLQGPILRSHHLHRPRSQSQRRLPAALHQDSHSRQWFLQSLRHGSLYTISFHFYMIFGELGILHDLILGSVMNLGILGLGCVWNAELDWIFAVLVLYKAKKLIIQRIFIDIGNLLDF